MHCSKTHRYSITPSAIARSPGGTASQGSARWPRAAVATSFVFCGPAQVQRRPCEGPSAHSRIASAQDLERAVDRGPQELIGLGLLVLGPDDLVSRRNGRHEIAQMPMTERWQVRQRRRIGLGIDRYIEIGLVVVFVSGRKPGADVSGGVSVARGKCGQSSEIEVVRPAAC